MPMTSLEKAIRDIKDVRVQGAKEIAIYGLEFLKDYARKHGFDLKFEAAAYFLEEARPTAVVLHNCIEIVKKKKRISTINRLIKDLKNYSRKIAKYSDRIIKNNWVIMTHCHSGEALAFIKHSWLKHKEKISVIATGTEPLEQGVKTAKELAAARIPVTIINYNAVGFFMKNVGAVIVGADALRKEGVVNKIGTSLLALAAKKSRKPFYVVANSLKIDKRKKFKIEERPAKEIYKKITTAKNLRGIKVRNPAFDITPWKYVTAVVTEKGVHTHSKILRWIG